MTKKMLLDTLRSMTIGQFVRMFTGIGSTLVILWATSGPFVKSYAADAFVDMLKEQGLDPEVFKKMQEQSHAISGKVTSIDQDAEKIKTELNNLRATLGEVSQQVQATNKSIDKVEDLVGKLLTIQLQRADMTFSPPGAGPVGVPNLIPQIQP